MANTTAHAGALAMTGALWGYVFTTRELIEDGDDRGQFGASISWAHFGDAVNPALIVSADSQHSDIARLTGSEQLLDNGIVEAGGVLSSGPNQVVIKKLIAFTNAAA